MISPDLHVPQAELEAFCRKWSLAELSVFGSALRPDFAPDNDVDILVSFRGDSRADLWDLTDMKAELEALFGRPVDLVSEGGLRNPIRRARILSTREVLVGRPT